MSKKLTTSANDVLDTDLIDIDENTIDLGSNVYIDGDLDVMGGLLKNGYQLFDDTINKIDMSVDVNTTIRITDDNKIQQFLLYNVQVVKLVFNRPVIFFTNVPSNVYTYNAGFGVNKDETYIEFDTAGSNVQQLSIVYCFGVVFIYNNAPEV